MAKAAAPYVHPTLAAVQEPAAGEPHISASFKQMRQEGDRVREPINLLPQPRCSQRLPKRGRSERLPISIRR
jgi:hypothetical protein